MATCHETNYSRLASCHVEVEASNETRPGLCGFTVPACKDHVLRVAREVEGICGSTDVSVHVVPLGESKYPPTVQKDG